MHPAGLGVDVVRKAASLSPTPHSKAAASFGQGSGQSLGVPLRAPPGFPLFFFFWKPQRLGAKDLLRWDAYLIEAFLKMEKCT